jgi:putative ABC transport system permease protein
LNYNISGGTEPEQVLGMRVSAGAFPMLGVPPQLGRTFTEEEEAPGQTVVVISDALWQRRYSANPGVIGQTLRVNGEPHEIIGVMPPRFQFVNQRFQIWVPIAFNPNDHDRDSHSFMAAARLRAGVSFETARDEIEAIGRRLDAEHREGHGATITPMKQFGVEYLRPTLKALAGAVALVLLIACVNVANLLLARATARQREFSVRSALGASRWRISSQLLAEGLLLAAAGGMAGIAVAWLATTVLATTLPGSVGLAPFRAPGAVHINGQVLLFTAGLSAVTGILFSLAPMLGGSRVQTATALKSAGDRGATLRFTVLRAVLVGAEVALAVVVLGAAGLMFKSVMRLTSIDPGLDSRNVLLMTMALPQPDFYGSPVRTTFCDDVQREVGALPGVVSVGAMSHVPFEGNAGRGFRIQGRPEPARNENPSANYRLTCPGYFRSLGIPIRRGRDFGAADTTTSEGVAIINEETARRYWPNEDPIGQRIRIGSAEAPWLTIVGVVGNVKHFGLENPSRRELYRPYAQAAWPTMSVTVKTATSPMGLAPAVRAALARIDPDQPVSRIRTMAEVVFNSVGERRFPMRLLGLFSIVALLLAAIGVYGVASYLVSQRTREIGIRVALGAGRKQVTRMIVGRSLLPIAAGLVAGIIGAVFAARLLASMLYEVRPSDPMVLGSIALLLAGAAMGASWIPARRAASVDPLVVLRQE